MISNSKEPLILNTDKEVGVVSEYNAAVFAAGKNQIAAATGAYGIASTIKEGSLAVVTGERGAATALSENSLAIGWGGGDKSKRCPKLIHRSHRAYTGRNPQYSTKESGWCQRYAGHLVFTG